ncbi:hypothetical protein DL96DRAFT_1682523 [Flagelloscypha sp. PMI_526]|nr:hypothetical protein DL96DRAFT_1682523 [Flagelloscypha sp. PMI_526]
MSDNISATSKLEGKLLLSLGGFNTTIPCPENADNLYEDAGWLESPNIFSQIYVVDDILHAYEHDKGLPEGSVKAHEVFQMIIGTGSGGLLAAMLGPLKMSTGQALEAIHEFHQSAFHPLNFPRHKWTSTSEPYAATQAFQLPEDRLKTAIENLVKQYLGDEGLFITIREVENLIPACKFAVTAITSANIASPTVFRGYRSRTPAPHCTLVNVLQATLASARLFSAVSFGEPVPQMYIGADAGHANPIETILNEAKATFAGESITVVLSVGAGKCDIVSAGGERTFPEEMVKLGSSTHAASERAISIIAVDDIGRAKAGGMIRDIQHIPFSRIVNSTYDNVKNLSYAERASFNPHLVCQPGTRMHILTPIFTWMRELESKPPVIWLEGQLGAGKSFVAHSVAAEADRMGILASSFFMTPGTSIRKVDDMSSARRESPSLGNLITSLIVDLAGLSQAFRWSVGELLDNQPRLATATPSVQMVELLLPTLFSLPNDRTFVWVIDGFDEVLHYPNGDEADLFFNTFCSSLSKLPPNFIIFITSRPLPNYPRPCVPTICHMLLDLTSPENMRDIEIISYAELQKLAATNRDFNLPHPDDPLAITFRSRAEGHPLWLRVIREHLRTSVTPKEELKNLLHLDGIESLDNSELMNSAFSQVIVRSIDLGNRENQKALKHVVLVLLSLQRPLPLLTILDILDRSSDLPVKTFESILYRIRSLFLGFDSLNPIEFIHLSLRDFFLSSASFGDLIQDITIPRDLTPGHFTLLLGIFQVMETCLNLDVSPEESLLHHPPLVYAASSWTSHIIQLNPNIHPAGLPFLLTRESLDQVKHFASDLWLERIVSERQTALALDDLCSHFGQSRRFEEWTLCSNLVVDLWRYQVQTKETDYRSLCLSMEDRGVRFGQMGLNHEAFAATQEAIKMYQEWEGCQEFEPQDYPWLLTALSGHLSDAGRHTEALAAVQEAVSILRRLVQEHPNSSQNFLARSLLTYSNCLSNVGRHGDSLAAAEESFSIRGRLVDETSHSFASVVHMAASMTTLSHRRALAGDYLGALNASQGAVTIRRLLLEKRPGFYEDDLADSLINLSNCLLKFGQYEDALAAIEEGVLLRRQLVQEQPNVFEADLAMSLNNFSICLSRAGQHMKALAAIEEGVALRRQLVQQRPKVFDADLASLLTNLSARLSDTDRHIEALAAIEEAISLHRGLVMERPNIFEADLATSLLNFSIYLSEADKHLEAFAACEEAVSLRRQLVQMQPGGFENDLANSLTSFSNRLSTAGQDNECFVAIKEAISIHRRLVEEQPGVFEEDLAYSLTNFSNHLSQAGRHNEALYAIEEAVSLQRHLVQQHPQVFEADLALSLNNLSCRLADVGRLSDSLAAIEEAVSIRRWLVHTRPNLFRAELAHSLTNFSNHLSDAGRHVESLAAVAEAVSYYHQLVVDYPQVYTVELSSALEMLSSRLLRCGRHADARLVEKVSEIFARASEDGIVGDDISLRP